MSTIQCPKCGEVFQVEESSYQEIVKQVRSDEFERELEERVKLQKAQDQLDAEEIRRQDQKESSEEIAKRDSRIAELQKQLESEQEIAKKSLQVSFEEERGKLNETIAKKEAEIARLKEQIDAQKKQSESDTKIAVQDASNKLHEKVAGKDAKISELTAQLESQQELAENRLRLSIEEERSKLSGTIAEKEAEIAKLSAQLSSMEDKAESERKLAVQEAEQALKEQHERTLKEQLQEKDDQIKECEREIERVRDWRAKLSVKMLGESLEKHCEQEFEKLRATAFRNAQFYKDTDKAPGSMGDYIFRELDAEGNEVVSIMFDMKTEQDVSQNKKKNADHLDKLSKDRDKKGCEYAVLVSTLEEDNDFYNAGIADVSYLCGHPKTYVVRPQFFIPIITLLRNAAEGSLEYKRELAQLRAQDIDVTDFEDKWIKFQDSFNYSCDQAGKRYEQALEQIDKAIGFLEKVRENLRKSANHVDTANRKAQNLTIRKLTHGNPTMKAKFDEARALKEAQADS